MLSLTRPWPGSPWRETPTDGWEVEGRNWRSKGETTELTWDHHRLPMDDWLPYNMLMPTSPLMPTSDMRVAATITPDTDDLVVTFALEAVGHQFLWEINRSSATLSKAPLEDLSTQIKVEWKVESLQAGKPTRIEFWHVDQMLAMYIDGHRVGEMLYNFSPEKRLRLVTRADDSVPIEKIALLSGSAPIMRWHFEGSPFSISRVTLDHDLYYRSARLPTRATKNPTIPGNEKLVEVGSPAFGTHPNKLAILGSDQFMMAGDNSAYSLDSRLWGNPDEYVAAQIDPTPFVVNRDLLIGKAWCVYWPSAYRIGQYPLIPDFGSIRFIR